MFATKHAIRSDKISTINEYNSLCSDSEYALSVQIRMTKHKIDMLGSRMRREIAEARDRLNAIQDYNPKTNKHDS